MKKGTKIFFFTTGVIIFLVLVYSFGFDKIFFYIDKTGYYFIPICGVWLVVYILNAYAWQLIIDNKNCNFSKLITVSISSFAINYITPFINLGGEPYRVLAVKEDIGLNNAVSSTLLYNMLHILSHLFLWAISIVLILFYYNLDFASFILLLISFMVILLIMVIFFAAHRKGVFKWIINVSDKRIFRGLHKRLLRNKKNLEIIDKEIILLFNEKQLVFWLALFVEFIARVIMSFEFYFILNSIDINISVLDAIAINAVSSLIQNILFFMPMGLGAREGSLYLIMESLGLTPMLGIYVSVINRIREFFWIFIGLLLIQFTGKSKYSINEIMDVNND